MYEKFISFYYKSIKSQNILITNERKIKNILITNENKIDLLALVMRIFCIFAEYK